MSKNIKISAFTSSIFVVCFFALTFSGIRSALEKYPRPVFVPNGVGGGYRLVVTFKDGMMVAIPEAYLLKTYPTHVIRAPRPSLWRIWSPLCLSTTMFFAFFLLLSSARIVKIFNEHYVTGWIFLIVAFFLILPLHRLAGETSFDYHEHTIQNLLYQKTIHVNPLLSRYRRYLMFQDWPGDFECRVPTDLSIPFPYLVGFPTYGSQKPPKWNEIQFKQ